MIRPDLEAIDKREQAATEGPWVTSGTGNIPTICYYGNEIGEITEDEIFIAHARTDIPAMSAYIKSLEKQLGVTMLALSYYGDGEIWYKTTSPVSDFRVIETQDLSENDESTYAGKRAREALAEIEKLRGENGA